MLLFFPKLSYAEVAYSNENHKISFVYFNEIPVPAVHVLTVNVSDYYTLNADNSHTINKINVFVKADEGPSGFWDVVSVNANSVGIDGTEYSSLTYDGNVLVSPGWVWTNKYKNFNIWKTKNSTYTISGTGSILLTPDCVPTAYNDIVTSFTVNTK